MSLATESCKNIWTWTANGHTGMAPGCGREQPVLHNVYVWQPSWNGYVTISIVSVHLQWQTTLQNGMSYALKLGLRSVLMEQWKEVWTPRYATSGQTAQKAVKTSEFTAHLFLLLVRTDRMLSRLSSKLTSRICKNISCCDSNPQACQVEKKHLQKLLQVELQMRQQ